MVLQNNVNALLIVPLSSPHWRYIWFTGTLSGVTMLNTNNRQLLKLSPSLTSSTRPSPLLLQRHTLGGGKQGAVGGRGSTLAGSLCSLQHPLGRLRNVGHNAVPEFGWLFGDCPWNCPRVLDDRGAPFFPHDLWVAEGAPDHHLWPSDRLKKCLYSAGLERGAEKSYTARRGSINNSHKFYFSLGT